MTARDRNIIAVVLAAALALAGWLLVVAPKRDQASKLGAQLGSMQTQLHSAQALLASAQAAQHSFAADYTELARLGEAVPADDNVPSLIYQVQSAASAAHVDFRSLVLSPSSGPVSAPAAPASAASATAAPGSAASATAVAQTLPPGATVGPAGFPIEPFTFSFRGSFFRLADFLGRLEKFVVAGNKRVAVSGRLMTLNAISLGPGAGGFPQITASINATTYLVPAVQGLFNGATPGGPSTGAAQPVSNSAPPSTATPAAVVAPVR